MRFNSAIDSLDPGYNVGGSPDNDVLWCVNPALVQFTYVDGELTKPALMAERWLQATW